MSCPARRKAHREVDERCTLVADGAAVARDSGQGALDDPATGKPLKVCESSGRSQSGAVS
jgi:hypothetical protein